MHPCLREWRGMHSIWSLPLSKWEIQGSPMSIWWASSLSLLSYLLHYQLSFTKTSFSDASVCAPSKLNFNGGYNCTGTSNSFTCSLICPDGAPFSFQPEPSYTCLYSEGEFKPKSIPECVTGNGIIIKGQEHSYRSYSKMDLMSMEWYSIFNGQ